MGDYSFSVSQNEELLGLRLYQYGWEQCAPLHSFGPFVRNHYLFHYVISGRGFLESNAEKKTVHRYDLEPGQGFLISPGQINTYCADQDDPWEYVWVEFDGLHAPGYLNEAGLGYAQPIYRPENFDLAKKVKDTMLYLVNHSETSLLHQIGYLCLFLDALIQSSSTRQKPREVPLRDFCIQEAVHFMELNYQHNLSIEEIADKCKLSRSYFSKIFKESKGCPPQEFLIRMRLSKAAEMMKNTSVPIGDIATLCGYPNQLHFSTAFKQHYGISPREWRSKNKLYEIN